MHENERNLGQSHGVKSPPVIAERQTAAEDTAVCLHIKTASPGSRQIQTSPVLRLSERDIFGFERDSNRV